MKNVSILKSLSALLTGGAFLAAGKAQAAQSPKPPEPNALEIRVRAVQEKLAAQEQGLHFDRSGDSEGLQTLWWGNWRNGGWGPGVWHNWRNGGWRNWRNGWGNGGRWGNWFNR